jgi:hypothetical protein
VKTRHLYGLMFASISVFRGNNAGLLFKFQVMFVLFVGFILSNIKNMGQTEKYVTYVT